MPRIKKEPPDVQPAAANMAWTPCSNDTDTDDDDDNINDMDGFQVSRSLPRYDEHKYTLRDLMMLLDTPNGIDLNPVYQRGFVWNEERQVGLVDSLFQGYYIPGLIFNKRVHTMFGGIRKEIMVCIDGKQRLTSVKRFVDGLFPCTDRHGNKWWFRQAGDKRPAGRQYLPNAAQQALWSKTFLCYEYVGMTDDQEHELFERVQRGNPLTPAEKSQAKNGPWQRLARQFESDFPAVTRISSNKRGAVHNKISSSFAQIIQSQHHKTNGAQGEPPFKGTNYWIDKYFIHDLEKNPCTNEQQALMRRVFDRFEELAKHHKRAFDNEGIVKDVIISPIEFIAMAVCIERFYTQTNDALVNAIRVMRRRVRRVHDDNVRRKPMVWTTLMEAMNDSLNGPRELDGDGDVENDRAEAQNHKGTVEVQHQRRPDLPTALNEKLVPHATDGHAIQAVPLHEHETDREVLLLDGLHAAAAEYLSDEDDDDDDFLDVVHARPVMKRPALGMLDGHGDRASRPRLG